MINNNKQIVLDFYKYAIEKADTVYASEAIAEDYIQHNPFVKTGKSGLLEAMAFLKQLPKSNTPQNSFKRVVAQGNYVALHYQVTFSGKTQIVFELYRLENGLLAEHWDAIKVRSNSSKNGNSELEGPNRIENRERTGQNERLVKQFAQDVLVSGDLERIGNYMVSDLIQHHPEIDNGIESFSAYLRDIAITKVHRVIAEGNFVVTQSSAFKQETEFVFYQTFRVEGGKIAELWSVEQQLPESMAHDNGMI